MSTVVEMMKTFAEPVFKIKRTKANRSTKENLFCRICKKDYIELKNEFTVKNKSTGVADILYSVRAEKKDVLVCTRCVCSNSLMLNHDGDAVVVFDNDRQKFQADTKKTSELTDELVLEVTKEMRELTGGW